MNSKVNIFVEDGKITRVEDKWDGKLPDSAISNVSRHWTNVVNPFWWANYWFGWFYSATVFVGQTLDVRVRMVVSLCGTHLSLSNIILQLKIQKLTENVV